MQELKMASLGNCIANRVMLSCMGSLHQAVNALCQFFNCFSCSARFSELKREGLIVKVGIRNTKTGSPAGIYRLP